ncbi:phage baseplate assembly protein V [Meridianimarinicoccus sp. RP-17]|uniref:phage baseplate assembly protein V n=1 Tax=Meridianimarinicoccus zhengii TaxID=2056810 RepID=UPI0013A6A6AC|nr:phage baseplate assembly protein V [Phycocomes zhengii]
MSDATFAVAEADRRIAGLVNIGVVTAVNGDGTARVQIGELGTAAIPVAALRAGGMQVWWMPTVGEQVVVLAPSGDLARGVVIASIFAGNAPSDDPSVPTIDLRGGDMVIKGGTIRIEADLDIVGKLEITGNIASEADITAAGGIAAGGTAAQTGKMTATGDIETTGDVKAGAVSLKTHTHPGDSGGNTGEPS